MMTEEEEKEWAEYYNAARPSEQARMDLRALGLAYPLGKQRGPLGDAALRWLKATFADDGFGRGQMEREGARFTVTLDALLRAGHSEEEAAHLLLLLLL